LRAAARRQGQLESECVIRHASSETGDDGGYTGMVFRVSRQQ